METRGRSRASARRGERGVTLVLTTLGILGVVFAAGLCIDFSRLYSAQTELQDAADAAAIAGASELNSTSGGINLAVTEATKTLNKYDVHTPVTIPASAVTFSQNLNGTYMSQAAAAAAPTSIRFIKVQIPPKAVSISLLTSLVGTSQSISASAIGGMSVSLTMNKFYTASIYIEPSSVPFVLGQTYTLVPKIWSSNAATSYRVLQGAGGDLILSGTIHAYGYANSNYVVAQLSQTDDCRITRIGVNTRFADYTWHAGSNATDQPPDTIISDGISYSTYRTMQGNNVVERADGIRNRRIITLPIAKSSAYNTTTRNVTANKLSAFFIRNKMTADCNLIVEYIGSHLVVPVGEYRPGDIQLNELSIPVLYR